MAEAKGVAPISMVLETTILLLNYASIGDIILHWLTDFNTAYPVWEVVCNSFLNSQN